MNTKAFTPNEILKEPLLTICNLRNKDFLINCDSAQKFRSGFTLVEIMVSVVVITIIAAGVLATFMSARLIFERANHRIQAFNFARKALDTMRTHYTYTDSAMAAGVNHTEAEIGGAVLTGRLEDAFNAGISYDVTEEPTGGYKQVDVTVTWDDEAAF